MKRTQKRSPWIRDPLTARVLNGAHQRSALVLLCWLILLPMSQAGQAAIYVLKDQDLRWSVMRTIGNDPPEFLFTGPQVGRSGSLQFRSVLDFDLRDVPATEKIVSARVGLDVVRTDIRGIGESIGSFRHLDAARPPRIVAQPVDPFRFRFEDLPAAPFVIDLNLGLDGSYNVTTAVASDHLRGFMTSPLGLMNNLTRTSVGLVEYSGFITAPQLVVETASPDALNFALESLGSNRYKATYSLHNEISLPLGLLDIEFDPALYREDTLQVSLVDDAAIDWTAEILNSGIEVPAVVTLLNRGVGLRGGERANGFQVEFDWLGTGLPGAQRYTVFDPVDFGTLYTGLAAVTTPVPLPMPVWSLLSGLVLLRGVVVKRRSKRSVAQ